MATKNNNNHPKDHNKEPDFMKDLAIKIRKDSEEGKSHGIAEILNVVLNELMQKDRETFQEINKEFQEIQANGYYKRNLSLSFGQLNLKIPRIRSGNSFRPAILPPHWKRIDKEYEELIMAMLCNGYTFSQIERSCKKLGLPYSKETLNDALDLIADKMDYYKNRMLDKEWLAVFIDACHTQMRDENRKNQKTVIFVAVGIKLDGSKETLGFWTLKGSENKAFWTDVFQDLIQRGATKILNVVTDNFNGLDDVVKKLFPLAYRQLCLVHLARNIHRSIAKRNSKEAMRLWRNIKDARNLEEGEIFFDQLVNIVKNEKPEMAELMKKQKNYYLNFLIFPEETRKHLYTTNAVESLNSGIERMRNDLGGYFASQRSLEINLFIQFANLHDLWSRKPIPVIKAYQYELNQIFALRYGLQEEKV